MAVKMDPKVHTFVCKGCHKPIEFSLLHAEHNIPDCPNNGKIVGRVFDCDWIDIVSKPYKEGIINLEEEMST